MRPRLGHLVYLVPLLSGWLAFHGALRYEFAQDDWTRLESASRPLASQLTEPFAAGAAGRRPLEQLYFALALRIAGDRALVFHLLAGLLHSANVLLVLLLLRRLLQPGVALVGAPFFACHVAAFTVL